MLERRPSTAALIYWATAREGLRKRKATGEIPWTNDSILAKYRFCNLRRRDDRVSQWLINNVFSLRDQFSPWSFLQFTALCRWVNWPPTLMALKREDFWPAKELDLGGIGYYIDEVAENAKAWTGAYMIRGPKGPEAAIMGKGKFVTTIVVAGLDGVRKEVQQGIKMLSLRQTWEALQGAMYWGQFMAGQVVTDWSYTPLLERAGDICAWAPQGPGSVRGYNRLLGLPLRNPAPPEDIWCAQLRAWRQELIEALGPEYFDLSLMDVQNALCEVDKFLRAVNGEGKPRSLYKPETRF